MDLRNSPRDLLYRDVSRNTYGLCNFALEYPVQKNQVTRPRLEKNFPRNPPKYNKFKKRIKKQQNEHNKNIITFFSGLLNLKPVFFQLKNKMYLEGE